MFPLSSLQFSLATMSLSTCTVISVYRPFSEVLIQTEDLTIKMIKERNSLAIFARILSSKLHLTGNLVTCHLWKRQNTTEPPV